MRPDNIGRGRPQADIDRVWSLAQPRSVADVDGKERLASRARVAASSLRFVGWAVIGHCGASVRRPFFSILLTDRPLFLVCPCAYLISM